MLAALFLVALLLRLYRLGHQNLWHDECWTLQVAAVPLNELPHFLLLTEGSKPPLYFAFIHYWMQAATGEFWLRLPSAIFGALSCVIAAGIGRELFSFRQAMVLASLLAFSPFHIYYSQEGRPYALWGLLIGVAFLFQVRFCANPRMVFLAGYVLFAELACYTFPYTVAIIGFSLLFSLLYRPALSKRILWQVVMANGIVLLLYVPWLLQIVESVARGESFQHTHRPVLQAAAYTLFSLGLGTSCGPSLEALRLWGTAVFWNAPAESALLVLGFLLLAALAFLGSAWLWRTNRNALSFAASGILCFWGGAAGLSLINADIPCNPRYAFPAIYFVIILIVAGCAAAIQQPRRQRALVGLFAVGLCASLYNLYFNPKHSRDDLRGAARFLEELQPPPQRLVLCAGFLRDVFGYYYHGNAPVDAITFPPRSSPEEVLAPVNQSLVNVQRFALIYSRPDHGDPARALPTAFASGWRLAATRRWTGVEVYVFDRARACYRRGKARKRSASPRVELPNCRATAPRVAVLINPRSDRGQF